MPDTPRPPLDRVAVLIPTYNERENLPAAVRGVREAVPSADVVVLDDSSPDGTGEVADALAAEDPQVFVIHRPGKEGLGAAYLSGFRWALDAGYDAVVEMDADGSHRPEHLPSLLAAAEQADAVIGSRWVPGGSVVNWPLHRKALSVGGNLYVKVLLGMPVNDATAGFRVYRADALRVMGLEDVASQEPPCRSRTIGRLGRPAPRQILLDSVSEHNREATESHAQIDKSGVSSPCNVASDISPAREPRVLKQASG